jgi:hypothetical protein
LASFLLVPLALSAVASSALESSHFSNIQAFLHLSEGFLKVAGTLFLLSTVTFKIAFLIGETRVGELQLTVFRLGA